MTIFLEKVKEKIKSKLDPEKISQINQKAVADAFGHAYFDAKELLN